jgi:hypothetical protein
MLHAKLTVPWEERCVYLADKNHKMLWQNRLSLNFTTSPNLQKKKKIKSKSFATEIIQPVARNFA